MRLNRTLVLGGLAGLTLVFLLGAAAYANWLQISLANAEPAHLKHQSHPKTELPSALRLTVLETGIAVVTARQVRAANLQFESFSTENLNLTRDGASIPFQVIGRDESARLFFFAEAVTHTHKASAVYLLRSGQGRRMAVLDATPTGAGSDRAMHQYHWEENSVLLTQTSGDDIWLGPLLLAPRTWELELANLQPTGGGGTLTVRAWSSTQGLPDPDHHLQIRINGRFLADWYWDGIKQETLRVPVYAGTLYPDQPNTLTITAPGDTGTAGDGLYLDWINLVYEGEVATRRGQARFRSSAANIQVNDTDASLLLFDVTDPKQPAALQGYSVQGNRVTFAGTGTKREYVALLPEQAIRPNITAAPVWKEPLQHAERGADYVAIVADVPGFGAALQPLLSLRQESGLEVTAVSLTQVYDEFGYGRPGPEAIRAFLTYAAEKWRRPPRFVLLVGDASYDWASQPQGEAPQLLPTALVRLSYNGYIATDAWYLQPPASSAPQMAIGRFPAQTVAQLEAMVQKTVAYAQIDAPAAGWIHNALLVADDDLRFDELATGLADTLADGGFQVHKLHMSENESIRVDIMSVINQGVGLVSYVGHGSAQVWGDEMVFRVDDARMLTNQQRLPVFATFTCGNGAFADPGADSLAEVLLWQPAGGVVAAIAPSGRAPVARAANTAVADAFYQAYTGGSAQTLGEALTQAKIDAGNQHEESDIIYLFNLLGDPALPIHRPDS